MMKLFRAIQAVYRLWKDFGEEERREASKDAYREERRRERAENEIWALQRMAEEELSLVQGQVEYWFGGDRVSEAEWHYLNDRLTQEDRQAVVQIIRESQAA